MHLVPSLLTKNPPKERGHGNFGCILGFPITPREDETQVDCLPIGVALSPLVKEEGYQPNNFETHNKSVHSFCLEIDR